MLDALQLIFNVGPTVYFLALIAFGFISFIVMVIRLTLRYTVVAHKHGKADAITDLNRIVS